MKPISGDYIPYILSAKRFAMGELFTFILVDGSEDYFTNLDFDVFYNGHVFKGAALLIEGLHSKTSVGWNVDEQDVKIGFRDDDTLAGSIFISGIISGLLDNATVIRQRAFWNTQNGIGTLDFVPAPKDVFTLFTGKVGRVEKIGQTFVELKVRSLLGLLDIDMPRNTYQPGCQWDLFDAGCTLDRNDFTFSGTVLASNASWITVSGGIPTPTGLDGDPYFSQGRITFTSGAREDLTLTLRINDTTTLFYMYPPISGILAGDTFDAWPGCSKRVNTCNLKYSNKHNFRGFTKVPPIHVSV